MDHRSLGSYKSVDKASPDGVRGSFFGADIAGLTMFLCSLLVC